MRAAPPAATAVTPDAGPPPLARGPVVALEGPSAVGKTTVAAALAAAVGAYVVPEVNLLFPRPADATPEWYFERQVDRWRLAADAARGHRLTLLDGDPLQPLWYNWVYASEQWQGLDAIREFYRPRLAAGEIGIPDLYVVLGAGVDTLRQRKAGDATRRRGGFEHHLRFVAPQRRYFAALGDLSPGHVLFLDAGEADRTASAVAEAARRATPEEQPVALFDALVAWLRTHPAA